MVEVAVEGHRHRRGVVLFVTLVVIAAAIGVGPRLARSALATSPFPFDPRTVGTPCPDDPAWVCGSIQVPLDRGSPSSSLISIAFRILPRTFLGVASKGTVVLVNGGPGDPSTGQYKWAEDAFSPLLEDHDLLLVDNRGSGNSDPIDCPEAQRTFSSAAIAQCRKILGSHAGDYGTIAAVDDLEAVLRRVRARNVDMYGESYGTFFAQVFALRYPQHLQRLVLDGALPLDVDPWRRDSLPAGLAALRTTCRADPLCATAGDPVALLGKVLTRLRVDIPPGRISRHAAELAFLLANAGREGSAYRELPAALRAYLAGDQVPLSRLEKQARAGGSGEAPAATRVSDGLLIADQCADYPQLFDPNAPVAKQRDQINRAYERTLTSVATSVRPFTPGEALHTEDFCVGWPGPTSAKPQSLGRKFPNVPTLVLEGGGDTVTPAPGARSVASEFRDSRFVVVPFVGHIAALNDKTDCASSIAATFLQSGTTDTGCLAHPPVPPEVDAFPVTFSTEAPVVPIGDSGRQLSADDRRTIAITRDVVADAFWTWNRAGGTPGPGLRGGTVTSSGPDGNDAYHLHLDAVRWTTDTTVSADITTDPFDHTFNGHVDVVTPAGPAHLDLFCADALGPSTVETISGAFDGRKVAVEVDAKLGL